MQALTSFKSANGIGQIQFFKSKTEGSTRCVGSANGFTFVTVADFDNSKPAFVADDPNGDNKLKFITNSSGQASFSL